MTMILYNVTVNIDNQLIDEWVKWMKEVHIPEVMATGTFVEYKFFRILQEEEGDGSSFCVQYFAENMADFENYQKNHAAKLQKIHSDKYKNRYVAFRTLLETV